MVLQLKNKSLRKYDTQILSPPHNYVTEPFKLFTVVYVYISFLTVNLESVKYVYSKSLISHYKNDNVQDLFLLF